MEAEITKAIIPVAGLGTRFLPLSRVLSKDFLPLVDKPVIQYIVEEVINSGIKEIIFVISPGQKTIIEYFKKAPDLEKLLIKRKKESQLKDYKNFEALIEGVKFSFVTQKDALGDGHAILQAGKLVKNETVVNSFGDDVFDSEIPALSQLISVYKTCNAPVLGLKRLPKDKIPAYGTVAVEKIANNLYKIKKIIEKPQPEEIMSDLVIVGKHVLTPDVFDYLKKAKPSKKGEIILAEVFDKMLEDGKALYGYEIKGEWLECGDKAKWLKSFFYLALRDPKFGGELKQYIKTVK
ncbi:MAG: sugar phosphate nucleotidyltransferase [Candidatus Staskawiczbacteria bacterium]|nr:sugar phosphate nucleotidyltransferase [Candidatus Staskawiczbacteria bacterium]